MLAEIEIRDFAIVAHAQVRFGPGFCVLSGETGAGKSIVVDAIGALLGERVGSEAVRAGCDRARLRAVFDLADSPLAAARLAELGIDADPDGLCLIARDIQAGGRGRCQVNGSTVTVAMLRELGELLLDVHGQHDHQSLLRANQHLRLLDAAGGSGLAGALTAYRALYQRWRALAEEAARLRLDEHELARRADMLRFQVDEIAAARLQPGEQDELLAERARLANAEKLAGHATVAYQALMEAEDAPAAIDRVAEALDALREIASIDADLAPLSTELEAAYATIEEAARALGDYARQIEADPQRLDQLEERLELIRKLSRKYGSGLESILEFGRRAADELAGLESSEERLAKLAAEQEQLAAELATAAVKLTKQRRQAADSLTKAVAGHLAELGMPAVTFQVQFAYRPAGELGLSIEGERVEPGPDGVDQAEFLLSANPGEPPRPLAKIASGGEISRVMLALKSAAIGDDAPPTMIFDEIDVGIGGVTIHSVAAKLAGLAGERQVICITHHAPIAARADRQIVVDKEPGDHVTRVEVREVTGPERVFELARMLGRQPPTDATLAMARELLDEVGRG